MKRTLRKYLNETRLAKCLRLRFQQVKEISHETVQHRHHNSTIAAGFGIACGSTETHNYRDPIYHAYRHLGWSRERSMHLRRAGRSPSRKAQQGKINSICY